MKDKNESLKRLFQDQFVKMVAVISKLYGLEHIEIAEDIVSETFLVAAETWGLKGIPPNPTAWLYVVAKQKAQYHFRRNKIRDEKVIPHLLADLKQFEEIIFSPENIKDSQLQMMFAICDPAIASEAQIGLALRILCGFGIDEIAEAFISSKETINKRLSRARQKLREENVRMAAPVEGEIESRLNNVLHIIYLLFNEGYYSKTQNRTLQKELCLEAMRLAIMLCEYEKTNTPKTNALLAMMCFHASRFGARETDGNKLILYDLQDDSLWDQELISRGSFFLNRSAEGSEISSYHLEARIACLHCMKEDTHTKWKEILSLYDHLLLVNYSPSVALNRLFALYKVEGRETALIEAERLNLNKDHFYFVLLGELNKDEPAKALANLNMAHSLARTEAERTAILEKIQSLQ